MSDRKPLVVGNWKMELSHKAAVEVAVSLQKLLQAIDGVEVVVCPSFPSLAAVYDELQDTDIALGAQNVHWEERGAWTGAVSVTQLKPFVKWCIVGHSEQRSLTGETDEMVSAKAELLLRHGLRPIICIGETLEEYQSEQTVKKITEQIQTVLQVLTRAALPKVVIAYEPIWAIGTGETPAVDQVEAVMLLIRKLVAARMDREIADRLRIIYGGSVSADTSAALLSEPGIDGVLVGGASVHPGQFAKIVTSAISS